MIYRLSMLLHSQLCFYARPLLLEINILPVFPGGSLLQESPVQRIAFRVLAYGMVLSNQV
jgi:hypothetical protein